MGVFHVSLTIEIRLPIEKPEAPNDPFAEAVANEIVPLVGLNEYPEDDIT